MDDHLAVEKFTNFAAAYEAFSDPDKLRKYDRRVGHAFY
jgi:hypothetical protein